MKSTSPTAPVESVRDFWNASPCGSETAPDPQSPDYFRQVESFRYALEPHILEVVPFARGSGKDILEIGCGLGTDGARWAQAGARYTGVDLTPEAVRLASKNFDSRGLAGKWANVNAQQLPFPEASFDIVYSHGVIHHAPDIEKVVSEIHRVLRPGGEAILMVYHRHSYNYYGNILFFRRLGILFLLLPGFSTFFAKMTGESRETFAQHQRLFKEKGWPYLSTQEFLNANTDGPGNPLSRVYSRDEAKVLLKDFKTMRTEVRYLNKRRLPLGRFLPAAWENGLARRWGWHLYLFATK